MGQCDQFLTVEAVPGESSLLAKDAQRASHALIHASAKTAHALASNGQPCWPPFVTGFTILHDMCGEPLPFVEFDNAMLMPIYHKLLYGLCKTFLFIVFGDGDFVWVILAEARARIAQFEKLLQGKMPHGVSRQFFDVVQWHHL